MEALTRLQQFHTSEHTTKLILPTTTRGKHLLQNQCTSTYLILIPTQTAEIVQGSQYGRSQNARCAQSATSRDGREQCQLNSCAKSFQFLLQVLASKACQY